MKTLILGHGREYKKEDIRCSPIDIDDWFNDEYDCLDMSEESKPDICFYIRTGGWTFAEDNSYDRIIDCTGGSISSSRGLFHEYRLRDLNEVCRILRNNGVFYTNRRVNFFYQKNENQLKQFEKVLQPGYTFAYILPPNYKNMLLQ